MVPYTTEKDWVKGQPLSISHDYRLTAWPWWFMKPSPGIVLSTVFLSQLSRLKLWSLVPTKGCRSSLLIFVSTTGPSLLFYSFQLLSNNSTNKWIFVFIINYNRCEYLRSVPENAPRRSGTLALGTVWVALSVEFQGKQPCWRTISLSGCLRAYSIPLPLCSLSVVVWVRMTAISSYISERLVVIDGALFERN